MDLIDSDLLGPDELDSEEVPVAALGGSVRVQSMDLVQRLSYEHRQRDLVKDSAAKGKADGNAWLAMVPEVLEICVLDKAGRPVKSAARWRRWGAKHMGEAVMLFNTAWRLSGMPVAAEKTSSDGADTEEATAKNSEASPS